MKCLGCGGAATRAVDVAVRHGRSGRRLPLSAGDLLIPLCHICSDLKTLHVSSHGERYLVYAAGSRPLTPEDEDIWAVQDIMLS